MKKEIASTIIATSLAFNSGLALATEKTPTKDSSSKSENRLNLPAESTYASEVTPGSHVYLLHDSDKKDIYIDLSQADGFTPDKNLIISDLQANQLGNVSADISRNFQNYLNKPYDGFGPLAGYTDGTNDYNQYKDNQSNPQVPAYSWMIHTGLSVDMPGIGKVEGGPGRAVSVLILNRTDRVYRFPTNSVTVEAGFQGWGRIWDGSADSVVKTEERLSNHYLTRMGEGVPEVGFIGQTDQGEKNADSVTMVSVEMIQWGNNENGSPRYQFRLFRAETVPAIKK